MLDKPPVESPKLSWALVALAVSIIYSTIPLARTLRDAVDDTVGRDLFLYVVALLLVVGAVYAFVNLRRRALPRAAYLWLGTILVLFGIVVFHLRDIPEEALHVIEYGLLSLLVFRALTYHLRDYSIYPAAVIIVGIIGIVDEYIQWVVPSRYFDLRDIAINAVAAALAQIAVFAGLRPHLIRRKPRARSYGRLCFLGAAGLALLAVGMQNTPQRVARYAVQHPALLFLLDGQSMMIEYGFRYHDAAIGVFQSRFAPEELARHNRERGAEVARILDRYTGGASYGPFLARYSVIRDPYVHEFGVHLYRRNYHIDRAREGLAPVARHYNIAYRENQILKVYFRRAIELSSHRWDDATEREVERGADTSQHYVSEVSKGVVTRMNASQALWLFIVPIGALLLGGWRLTRWDRQARGRAR